MKMIMSRTVITTPETTVIIIAAVRLPATVQADVY